MAHGTHKQNNFISHFIIFSPCFYVKYLELSTLYLILVQWWDLYFKLQRHHQSNIYLCDFCVDFWEILNNTACVCLNEWRNYNFDNEVKWRDSELMKLMIDFCSGIKVNLALMPNIYIEKLIKATAPDQKLNQKHQKD